MQYDFTKNASHNNDDLFQAGQAGLYGYDEPLTYLVDTEQQGGQVKTTLKNIEFARNEKGQMSSRNKRYTIDNNGQVTELKEAIKTAIFNNATEYFNVNSVLVQPPHRLEKNIRDLHQ